MAMDVDFVFDRVRQKLLETLRWDLDLGSDHDRFRLVVSAANRAVARLVRREVRHRGDMEWALWRVPVLRAPLLRLRGESAPTLGRGRVLWIPGWGDSPMSWLGVLAGAFAGTGYDEVVVPDFPGFNGSLAHRRCITDMDRILEVARDQIQELHPAIVGGHSLGGWLATWGLLHADARTPAPSRLLLMAPSGVTGGPQERELWRAEFKSWTESDVETYLARVLGRRLPWIEPVMHRFVPFMKRADTQEFLNSVGDRHFLDGRVGELRPQVRLLWGEQDGVVPERFATEWISRLPSVRYEKWRGVGHMPHLEAPLRLARWIRDGVG